MGKPKTFWPLLASAGIFLATAAPAASSHPPPPPPLPDRSHALGHLSPVEYFRGLLSMTPGDRERALAGRTPSARAAILAKVQEYEALPRAIREARLCQTELHWELSSLMRLPPGQRADRLKGVSAPYRPMVENLLRQWDEVPVNTQKSLLEQQDFIGVYLRMQASPAGAQEEILDKLPPDRRAHWQEDMGRWQALPEKERTELCAQFQRFCAMSGAEQQETVSPLSAAERQAMERTLQEFNRLGPAQRVQCMRAFGKFATMAPQERNEFLKNAARWEAMTQHERQLWRELVRALPPLPPGFPGNVPPMPPLPARFRNVPPPPFPPNVTTPVIIALSPNDVR